MAGQEGKLHKKPRVYMDYAATTPVDKRVLKAMLPFFSEKFGNPASMHSFGQEAKQALDMARMVLAKALGAEPKEIVFTSSATESNNLALKGITLANKIKGRPFDSAQGGHIIISSIEHDCVLSSAQWLEKQGFEITKLNVNKYGLIDLEELKKTIKQETILVSIMHANNEIGVIQPIKEIGWICKEKNIVFHTDAAQSFGKIPINANEMNIDLLTASSHKMYGPKGVACLYIRSGIKIEPIIHGGGQEFGLRSSTVNVAGIVGFAKAVEFCENEMEKEGTRLENLRDKLISGVLENIPHSYLNGPAIKRLPNNINFRFDFVEGESIIAMLDFYGIAASTGSACSSPKLQPSHVLLALGLKPGQAHGSLRLSLGRWTTEKEIDYVLEILPGVIKKLREISPFKDV